jgi:hypothetical protein
MITPVPVKLPAAFEAAMGYGRAMKWVSFCWEPCGDESWFDDGICSGTGHWHGFLEFTRHPNVAPWLKGYNLGNSDEEATHALLCDLESRDLYVGDRREVAAFVHEKVMGGAPAPVIDITELDMEEVTARIREFMREVPAPSIEEIEEKMRRDQLAVRAMVAQLGG